MDIKTFKGSDVKILRVEAGLQHNELAKESRVWEKTVRGWELGRIPSETARVKILNFLQKKLGRQDLDQLLKEIAGRPKPPAPVPAPPPKPPPVEPKVVVCRCVNGALLDVPAWENREKPKNWMAVIDVDGASPGGLSRRFLSYGRGDTFYLVEQLTLFDPVEFAADRMFGSHTRKERWYGVVVAMTDVSIHFEESKDGPSAVLLSKSKRTDPSAFAHSLLRRRDELLNQAERLRKEAGVLTGNFP